MGKSLSVPNLLDIVNVISVKVCRVVYVCTNLTTFSDFDFLEKSFASYSCNSVLYYLQSSSNGMIVGMNGLHHACDFILFLHAFRGHVSLYENLYVDTFQTPLKWDFLIFA